MYLIAHIVTIVISYQLHPYCSSFAKQFHMIFPTALAYFHFGILMASIFISSFRFPLLSAL